MFFELAGFAASAQVADAEIFAEKCEALRILLEKVNQEVNLTRITGKEDFELKHAADSLLLTVAFPELAAKKVHIADIGCGAGFPSLADHRDRFHRQEGQFRKTGGGNSRAHQSDCNSRAGG